MRYRLEARQQPSRLMGWLSPVLAALLTVVAGFVLFSALGKDPVSAFHTFFIHPVRNINGVAELLQKASPLMLVAVGLAGGYRANVWNIGAEGQLILGAICAGGVALYFHESESALVLPLMLVAGAGGGMLWAAIPALLRTRFHTNEILVSLMLVYVAGLLLSWLVHGPWRDPDGFNFPQSKMFPDSALYPMLIEGTRLNAGFLVSLAAAGSRWRWWFSPPGVLRACCSVPIFSAALPLHSSLPRGPVWRCRRSSCRPCRTSRPSSCWC